MRGNTVKGRDRIREQKRNRESKAGGNQALPKLDMLYLFKLIHFIQPTKIKTLLLSCLT